MIITQTPYRISLFGGGTDYPDWYLRNGGQVLSTTIDKYVYISCRYLPPFFEHKLRLVYSEVETCNHADELKHPAAREVLKHLGFVNGLEIHYDGDLPSRSGMGSSSAFTAGLIKALYCLKNQEIGREQLANEAIYVEQQKIGESVGSQDQVNAAYGGFNNIQFRHDGTIRVIPVDVSDKRKKELNDQLMLFYTGIMRTAETVSSTYAKNTVEKAAQLERMYKIVDEAIDTIVSNASLDGVGRLLHESWIEKRKLSDMVSNTRVDDIYQSALKAGALGGKLCGAGGGGMMLLYVPRKYQSSVRSALSSLLYVPFRFSKTGSQLIFSNRAVRLPEVESNRSKTIKKFIELEDI